MKHYGKAALFSASLIVLSAQAFAQIDDSCGGAPNRNIKYSSDIRNVLSTLERRNATGNLEEGVSIPPTPEMPVPLQGFLKAGASQDETRRSDLNNSEIKHFVQRELANEKTAMLAECMYYFCKAGSQTFTAAQLAAVSAASQMCTAAFTNEASRALGSGRGVAAFPSFVYVDLTKKNKVNLEVKLTNTSDQPIRIAQPLRSDTALVSYRGRSNFTLDPSASRVLPITVKKPSPSSDKLYSETLRFQYYHGAQTGPTITFAFGLTKPPPLPTHCDVMGPSGLCAQCTVPLDITVANAGEFNISCPKMAKGRTQIAYKFNTNFSQTCDFNGCAHVEYGIFVKQSDGVELGEVSASGDGQQAFVVEGSSEERVLRVSDVVPIRVRVKQTYVTPGVGAAIIRPNVTLRPQHSYITLKSLSDTMAPSTPPNVSQPLSAIVAPQ